MNALFSSLTFLEAAPAGGPGNGLMMPIVFGLIIVIFYFLIIRPQNKKQKDLEKMLKAIKKGDKVITIGGIRGLVERVGDDTVVLRVDEGSGTSIEFNKSAIANLQNPPAPAKADKKDKKAEAVEAASDKQP